MRNILVLGGTGFVGRVLVERLVRRSGGAGGRIVVPTRRAARGNALRFLPTVEVVQADVNDPRQLARLLNGCDAVVNLVAILHGSEEAFRRAHAELPRQLAEACRAAGVRRVLHVSALGASSSAPSRYLRSKAAGEAVLESSGLDLTVLRPSVLFGAEDRFLNTFAGLQAVFPVIPLAGADARFQPCWVDDVAEALVRCLERPETIGQTYECAGPQVYTLRELVRLAGRWAGHPRPVLALPGALGRLQAGAMSLMPGEPLMSCDNLDSMKVPNVATGALPGLPALGITPAPLEQVAPSYLGRRDGVARLDPLRATARR
ncbi:complex I NDUFA9 subunit family protein [Aquincola sp. MAHUQ-54]|uniref:Complex I NDUFA9 subunit family protein n=1 Tax=Aquincola agrisoli TaxID=3119538 RepID=A0AAW9QIL4_9BURK